MLRRMLLVAATIAAPAVLAAQTPIPNAHASDTAKSKVTVAKAKVAEHRATRVRGSVERADDHKPTWLQPAQPSTGATRAMTKPGVGVVTPATPATGATPAIPMPPRKPSSPGQSGNSHWP